MLTLHYNFLKHNSLFLCSLSILCQSVSGYWELSNQDLYVGCLPCGNHLLPNSTKSCFMEYAFFWFSETYTLAKLWIWQWFTLNRFWSFGLYVTLSVQISIVHSDQTKGNTFVGDWTNNTKAPWKSQ